MKSAEAQGTFRQRKLKGLPDSSKTNFAFGKLFTRTNIIIILFAVFLFLRLFTSIPYILLSDDLKYIETAKNFPYHTLYNDQLYLLHPPLYPYVLHFFTLIFGADYIAGIFISILSAIITFFAVYKLFMMLTNNFNITFFILLFYALSEQFIRLSRFIFKDSMQVMLIFLSLYYFVRIVKFNEKKSAILASLFAGLLAITSDHVVFIFPAFVLSYLLLNSRAVEVQSTSRFAKGKQISIKKLIQWKSNGTSWFANANFPNLKYAALPFLFILIVYSSWTGIKFYQYSNNEYYPNGYLGTPLSTDDLGLMQAVNSQFFDEFESATTYTDKGITEFIKRLLQNVGYMLNIEPFSLPRGLNTATIGSLLLPKHIVYAVALYLPLAFVAFLGFLFMMKEFLKTGQIHNNTGLYILGLFIIFLIPASQQLNSPRYLMPSYVFLSYFTGYGFATLFQKKQELLSKIMLFIVILLLLLIPFWYYNNNNFIFFNEPLIGPKNTGDFINDNIPKSAGIMVQAGYTPQLLYLTDNRILGLYPIPEKLLSVIDYYNISYVIFGKYYTFGPVSLSKDSAEFIADNPGKFQHIATIKEEYPDEFYQDLIPDIKDEVYIYRVIKN